MSGPRRTWDGLEIAADHPHGSTIVVRRQRTEHPEFLLLHRNARGPGYEGDWAWTSPAGARQPDEAVYPAALRELAEEAGIVGMEPWPIDLSERWAVWGLDVGPDVEVDLVDPEHDRFAWVGHDEAMTRVRPRFVAAAGIGRMPPPAPGWFSFEPMTVDRLPELVRWRSQPHVLAWFHTELADVAAAAERYADRLDGRSATRMWSVHLGGRPVGYVQDYPVAAYDDYAVKMRDREAIGFDYLIGEPELVGRGLGPQLLWSYLRDVLCRDYPQAPRFTASPDHRNTRSLRALHKCGLVQGLWIDSPGGGPDGDPAATEIVCTLDRFHWFGPTVE